MLPWLCSKTACCAVATNTSLRPPYQHLLRLGFAVLCFAQTATAATIVA